VKLRYPIVGWAIVWTLIGYAKVRADAVLGAMNASAASAHTQGSAANSPATLTRRIDLNIPAGSFFASREGRGLLKYLVRCALDAGTEAELTLPGENLTFTGDVGLAPAWAERALTLTEQRWVSACIHALTNKLGRSVRVDLRGAHPKIEADTEEERRTYPLHEGGFFGNLFQPKPVGYVCEGADRKKMLELPIGKLRLCAQPSGITMAGGQPLSACGFIITGPCSSPSSFVVDGQRFDEVVHTWLSPEPRD
jgi:hypothetical protein